MKIVLSLIPLFIISIPVLLLGLLVCFGSPGRTDHWDDSDTR